MVDPGEESAKRLAVYLGIIAIVIAALIGVLYLTGAMEQMVYPAEKIGVVYIDGFMITGNLPSGFGFASSEDIGSSIRKVVDDPSYKALVLRVNSPGGTVSSSNEILTEVKRAKESGIPIVVSMGDVAASGAYYASSAADVIMANPDTTTGSLGVVWAFEDLSAYYEEEGINYTVAKSGEMKDMGSPWRALSQEELDYANEVVMDIHQRFVSEIAANRGMNVSYVANLSDGRIYVGARALELGLVDELGNLYDAIDRAAELGGIKGKPEVDYINSINYTELYY